MPEAATIPLLLAAAALFGVWRPKLACAGAALAAALSALVLLRLCGIDDPRILDAPWIASFGARFALSADALGGPFALYAAAMAAPVLVYAAAYIPRHLEEERRPPAEQAIFAALMLGFLGAMILLALAQDLLLIFLALELTSLFSFLLIRYDRTEEARAAARLALVVTAGSAMPFLAGTALVAAETGTTHLAALRTAEVSPLALALLAAGTLGKSAQVPLHVWLPRAMTAPTPVSAYLHSAALVAAGVFVLQRLRFLLEGTPEILSALLWLSFLSILGAGLLALAADGFKRILAWSTIAQYGYAVALVALGGEHGLLGAPLFLLAHGLAKCGLFMTAGAVTQATHEDRLSQGGGFARSMPLLAAAAAICAAAIAGLPATFGFFKDDLLMKAALAHGPLAAGLVTLAVAVTAAYMARFWFGVFGGRSRPAAPPGLGLTGPVAAMAALSVLLGLWWAPVEPALRAAAAEIGGALGDPHLAYPTQPEPAILLTLAGWLAGAILAAVALRRRGGVPGARPLERLLGPDTLADGTARRAGALSNLLHRLEVHDARDRLAVIFVVASIALALGLAADARWPVFGALGAEDAGPAAALAVVAAAGLAATFQSGHISFVLILSFAGFGLALVFSLGHAPDVAIVVALVETTLTLLLLSALARARPDVLARARRVRGAAWAPAVGVISGLAATAAAWTALSREPADPPTIEYVTHAELAHAKDVVTAILTDFRGLDTVGELTVLAAAAIGASAIWWERRA